MQAEKLRKGPWLKEEDDKLASAVAVLGEGRWDSLAKASGLRRSGKSCRLRWMNYLRPDLKHGHLTVEEQRVLIELHEKWGNKWSRIAQRLPGRTDNEIKNYWKSYLRKKARALEKESFSSAVDSSGNTSLRSECETASPCSINDEGLLIKDDSLEFMTADSCEAVEFLNLTGSPYETRLIEWISNMLPDPCDSSKMGLEDEYWNFNVYHPEWISDDCTASAWDFSLWDGA